MRKYLKFLKHYKGIDFLIDETNIGFNLPWEMKKEKFWREEMKVDNTDIYVPDGWKRIFQSKSLLK